MKERSSEEQELLWENERLRNRDKEVDENHRRYVESSRRLTEEHAVEMITGTNRTAIQRLRDLMEFLLQPASELSAEELKLQNELLEDYKFASLLRIYRRGVWHERFCFYLRDFIWPRWKESSVKKSRERRRRN